MPLDVMRSEKAKAGHLSRVLIHGSDRKNRNEIVGMAASTALIIVGVVLGFPIITGGGAVLLVVSLVAWVRNV